MRHPLFLSILGFACLLNLAPAEAATEADAYNLKNQALGVLRSGVRSHNDNKAYDASIEKLKQAMAILQELNSQDQALMQEISAALFWAQRFRTAATGTGGPSESGRNYGGSGNWVPAHPEYHNKAGTKPPETGSLEAPAAPQKKVLSPRERAELTFQEAEAFEKVKEKEEYMVVLRWLQLAEQFSEFGDLSTKALTRARAAQQRYLDRINGAMNLENDAPAMKLLEEAEQAYNGGDPKGAFKLFSESLAMRDTLVGHSKYGKCLFAWAEKKRIEMEPIFAQTQNDYNKALSGAKRQRGRQEYTDWSDPALIEAKQKSKKLQAEALDVLNHYKLAMAQYQKILDVVPASWDLEADAHVALCCAHHGDVVWRSKARLRLAEILRTYRPLSSEDSALVDLCKKEFDRLNKMQEKK